LPRYQQVGLRISASNLEQRGPALAVDEGRSSAITPGATAGGELLAVAGSGEA